MCPSLNCEERLSFPHHPWLMLSLVIPGASLLGEKAIVLFYKVRIREILRKSLKCLVNYLCRICMCEAMQYINDQGSVAHGQLFGKSKL